MEYIFECGSLLRFISYVNACSWKRHRKGNSMSKFFKRLKESFEYKHEDRNSIKLFGKSSLLNIYLVIHPIFYLFQLLNRVKAKIKLGFAYLEGFPF